MDNDLNDLLQAANTIPMQIAAGLIAHNVSPDPQMLASSVNPVLTISSHLLTEYENANTDPQVLAQLDVIYGTYDERLTIVHALTLLFRDLIAEYSPAALFARVKSYSSIQAKILRHQIEPHEVFDTLGLRVLLQDDAQVESFRQRVISMANQSDPFFTLMPRYSFTDGVREHNPDRLVEKENAYRARHMNLVVTTPGYSIQQIVFELQLMTATDYKALEAHGTGGLIGYK